MKSILKPMLAILALTLSGVAMTAPAQAQVEIDITQGNVQPLPIALPAFQSGNQLGQQITEVVTADLKRSGLFAPVAPAAFIQKDAGPDATPRFQDWTVINAQALVVGRVTPEADGRLRVDRTPVPATTWVLAMLLPLAAGTVLVCAMMTS